MGRQKSSGSIFRFIRNHSEATAANVYLLLYPRRRLLEAERESPGILDRVFSALRLLSDDECRSEGRTYGGGLNKLEPRELGRVAMTLSPADRELLRRKEATQLLLSPAFT